MAANFEGWGVGGGGINPAGHVREDIYWLFMLYLFFPLLSINWGIQGVNVICGRLAR